MKNNRPYQNQGFTLIEIVVAMTVFAILGLITTRVLHDAITHYQRVRTHVHALQTLQQNWAVMQRDLSLALYYPLKQGETPNLAFWGDRHQFYLTRVEPTTSQLQLVRIRYTCDGNQWTRQRYGAINTQALLPPLSVLHMLANLKTCHLRYIDKRGVYTDEWTHKHLPAAIELTIASQTFDTVIQNIALPYYGRLPHAESRKIIPSPVTSE